MGHNEIFLPLIILVTIANVNGYNLSDYRLPKYAVPSDNYFSLDLRQPEADSFRAESWLDITVFEPDTYELVVNVDPNFVNLSSMDIEIYTATFVCHIDNSSVETQLMALACTYDLYNNVTSPTLIKFFYTANFSDEPYGLYKNKFMINGSENYVIFSQFEATMSRRVFPSFDEPEFKAPTKVMVEHYENLTVVSNMNSSDEYGFLQSSNMSTYLVAIVAGPNETWALYSSSENGTFNFSIFTQRIYKNYVSVALENGPKLIKQMGNWTNLPYEKLGNSKMTFAAIPGMNGAMENWGLITYSENLIVDEANKTSLKSLINSITIMAHEISHQWFGDYVTLAWWTETWLSEGFASYFEWYLPSLIKEEYEFDKMFLIQEFQPALQGDNPSMVPLSDEESKVNSPEEILAEFDDYSVISNNKGGSVIRMIRNALGENIFQQAIRNYLKENALGNVKATNLIDHLQAALPNNTNINLNTYLDSWIYEPGYPIVKTSMEETHLGTYIVSINIYKFKSTLNNTERELSIWWVPITYATSDQPFWDNATTQWVGPLQTSGYYIPKSNDSWSIVNVHATGFYRVDYDSNSLARIFKVLNNSQTYKQIPVLNRAQLIDDLFNIAKYYTKQEHYDSRPYQNAFSFVAYLKYEQEYYPWYTYLKEVQFLLDMIIDETTLQTLKADVLDLINTQLIFPNDTNSKNITPSEILKRNLLLDWACKLGHKDAIKYVKEKFDHYKTSPASVDNNYRDVIICYGIQNSDNSSSDYNTLLTLYRKSILPQEQNDILVGLTCISDFNIFNYLESTLKDEPIIGRHFWSNIFEALYKRGPIGLEAALRFISGNANAIMEKWKKPMDIQKMIKSISNKVIRSNHISLLSDILAKYGNDSKISLAVVKGLIKVQNNLQWLEKFGDEITSILVYDGSTTMTTTPTSMSTPTTSDITTHRNDHNKASYHNSSKVIFVLCCSMFIILNIVGIWV